MREGRVGRRRIGYGPRQARQVLGGTRHHRADLFGAEHNNGIDLAKVDLISRLNSLARNLDPDFGHGLDRKGI
jgi:hypothetical protein